MTVASQLKIGGAFAFMHLLGYDIKSEWDNDWQCPASV